MTFFVVEIVEGDRLMLDQHRSFLIEKRLESLNGLNERIENDFCMSFLAKFARFCEGS